MNIVLASDHGAIDLRGLLTNYITKSYPEITVIDLGTTASESVDYPDFADQLVHKLTIKEANCGILCCGTGIGMSMRANRYPGIRAAVVYDAFTAKMAKAHNNANVLCLGGRTIDNELAKTVVSIWLNTEFEGGRHELRVKKLDYPLL